MNRKRIAAWVLYDFANSVYPVVILGPVFSVFYIEDVVGNSEGLGDQWWGYAMSASVLFVAFSSPLLGSIADLAGVRKRMLLLYTHVCVVSVALFVTIEPGMILWGFALAVVANIGFEGALVYYNAYLPEIAPRESRGFVSGLGFGIGYAGSIAGLLIAYLTAEQYHLTWLSVAAFFALFSIPTFLFLPRDRSADRTVLQAAVDGITGFRRIVGEVLRERELRRFLLAFFFYIDGVLTVIVFASSFAAKTLSFESGELILLFLVVQVAALLAALALAKATDRLGPRRVITMTLVLWIAIVVSAYFVESKTVFFAIGALAGIGLGTIQSASRALMSVLIPDGKEAEMFGFYAFCGKSSSWIGPLVFGKLSFALGGNQRVAILVIAAFFIVGLLLLQRVKAGGGAAVASRD
ncbi:MAG: MFS transporter [Gemmatimonadetes bacterium]|jgi:UMF1 family MFS transporter|nr:MFS transporter [Gemmatimonadota bacterium]